MEIGKALKPESVLVAEYIRGSFVPLSRLAHGWEMHSAVSLTPAEERAIVREPAQAVPAAVAERVGKIRVLIVPFIACMESGDMVYFTKPEGETHTSVWEESDERLHLVLSCRELNPHDTGFEFLASVGELLRPRLTEGELERYTQLLEEEMREGVSGEIDEDARAAKEPLLPGRGRRPRRGEKFAEYRDISFVSTAAEYMHGLWHDVQIRVGPEHLPLPQLRRRMKLLSEMFPPNPGYTVFAKELNEE
ncbi:MAG TPA: hypothetical protein VM182_12950 [Terriglobia bacterium]|nr:hypothetical protein [Terriglobia bacterium]